MNKAQLHLTNFLLLVEEAGSLTKLARACGYENSASLSQLKRRLEQQAGDESARGIRPSLAAKLESGMHKRKGWLNRDHSKDQRKSSSGLERRVWKNKPRSGRCRCFNRGPFCYRYPQYQRNPNHRQPQS